MLCYWRLGSSKVAEWLLLNLVEPRWGSIPGAKQLRSRDPCENWLLLSQIQNWIQIWAIYSAIILLMVSWCFDLVYAIFTTMHESFLPMYFLDLWQQSLKGRFIFRLSERGIWLSWNENLWKTHLREQRESPFPNFYFQCIISWVYWWDCSPIHSFLKIFFITYFAQLHFQCYPKSPPYPPPTYQTTPYQFFCPGGTQ